MCSNLTMYLFDVTGYNDRCGAVEYTDGRIERIVHEAGWIDARGRHVAAIRDSRGSLRATLTHGSVRPAQSGSSSGGGLQLGGGLGGGSGVSAATGYENLTAYYPFGLPFSDWQGGGRDLFSGKELERASGLFTYDFHARRYDPQLGLFLAPDPIAASYPNLNPYLYCAANPVSLTDPTGCIIKAFDNNSINNGIVDIIDAANLNKEIDAENMFYIDENNLQINLDMMKLMAYMENTTLQADQIYLLKYLFYATTNSDFTLYLDYTPDSEYFPESFQEALNTFYEKQGEHHIEIDGQLFSFPYEKQKYKGSERTGFDGAFTFELNGMNYSTINPDFSDRPGVTIHEALGHGLGSILGYTHEKNNAHALQIEACYASTHGANPPLANNHSLPQNFSIKDRSLLKSQAIEKYFSLGQAVYKCIKNRLKK